VLWFLLTLATHASVTSTELDDQQESGTGTGDCIANEDVEVELSTTINLVGQHWSTLQNFVVIVEGRHEQCTIILDDLEIRRDGILLLDQQVNLSGFDEKKADWHVSAEFEPDIAAPVKLDGGGHTFSVKLTGFAANLTNKMRLTVEGNWLTWRDFDGDGYVDSELDGGDDCDDTNADINPGETEDWYDGIDKDCDGKSDYDRDGDGYDSDEHGGDDCNDTAADINPGETERWYDGIDKDCDGANDYDQDGDGYLSNEHGGDDCDDTDPSVAPDGRNFDANCNYIVQDDGSRQVPGPASSATGCSRGAPAAALILGVGLWGWPRRRRSPAPSERPPDRQ